MVVDLRGTHEFVVQSLDTSHGHSFSSHTNGVEWVSTLDTVNKKLFTTDTERLIYEDAKVFTLFRTRDKYDLYCSVLLSSYYYFITLLTVSFS